MRKSLLAAAAACTLLGVTAPAHAIVGGSNVPAGSYTNVAEITLGGLFGCTGTLIAPNWVMTAGHCGSLTGAAVSTPAAWPPQAINVRMGSNKPGKGTVYPVAETIVEPDYLMTSGYDITLLRLTAPAAGLTPTPVANASERGAWDAGDTQTIVGWGTTSSGGSSPSTLQQAQVPVTTDPYCANAYSDFDATTMVCAGFPQGGVDTCQGDSGGPMFGTNAAGALRLTGATSFGQGCAEPGFPGVYARVADTALRTWIASVAPAAIAP
jgi:secreted trypsin-like serine protease